MTGSEIPKFLLEIVRICQYRNIFEATCVNYVVSSVNANQARLDKAFDRLDVQIDMEYLFKIL